MTYEIDTTIARNYLHTKNDANDLNLILEHLTDTLFQSSNDPEEILLQEIPHQKALLIKKIAESENINLKDKNQVQSLIHSMKIFLASLPVVTITLAIEPKEKMINAITSWFYQNYKTLILLDVKIDPNIIGGSIIQFKGKFNDYSLKKALEVLETEGLN